jgi:AraC-like DNA-binding protein
MAPTTGSKTHPRIPLPASLPGLHALLTPAVAHAFETLRIAAAIRARDEWYAIHTPLPLITWFELSHGKETERDLYNGRCLDRALSEGRTILGRHAGFSDLFVPIDAHGHVHAVLVTGPFLTERPTGTDILERWRWITGRQGHPSDPEFAHYVAKTLDALLLEGEQLSRYRRFLECFAALCSGTGDAGALSAEAAALRTKLEQSRFTYRVWEEARTMVDARTERVWLSLHRVNDLSDLGLARVPDHVLVGLVVGQRDAPDPVENLLKLDAFQRACVELARATKNAISGRVGEHGVMFLVASSGARARRALTLLAARARELAQRRFGLSLHLGASSTEGTAMLSTRYEEALAAAENALSRGEPIVHATPGAKRAGSALRQLRSELSALGEQPNALAPRFERYMEAVAVHCGYRLDLAEAHLEAGFEQAARALFSRGALDPKRHLDTLDRTAHDATTVADLFAAYRRAIADLVDASEHPVEAARDRNLRRALEVIHQRFTEPLASAAVARIAGFAPGYFCQLFKQRERMTFSAYIRQLRVERAKQLLAGTDLGIERVGQLSGLAPRHYFDRVFKKVVRVTPVAFRNAEH